MLQPVVEKNLRPTKVDDVTTILEDPNCSILLRLPLLWIVICFYSNLMIIRPWCYKRIYFLSRGRIWKLIFNNKVRPLVIVSALVLTPHAARSPSVM